MHASCCRTLGSCERDWPSGGAAAGAARVSLVTRLPHISCSHIYCIIRRDVIVFDSPASVVSFRGARPAVWLRAIPEEDRVVVVVIVVVVVVAVVAVAVIVVVPRGSLPRQVCSAYFLPPRRRRRLSLPLIVAKRYNGVTIALTAVSRQKTRHLRVILGLANTCVRSSLRGRTPDPAVFQRRLINQSTLLSPVAACIVTLLCLVLDPV
ncbi:hypothetical protein X777_09544 [Ooceraea biroi]|uniref:Uncharacterized protein n=1 Tax=Ooceraea biroi TaxID=2015173 RepID=A0A026W6P8_OOCBI|nr:hypothetical protein X777_09544 [Ooceraea biroi]